jgi:hypothetical protein
MKKKYLISILVIITLIVAILAIFFIKNSAGNKNLNFFKSLISTENKQVVKIYLGPKKNIEKIRRQRIQIKKLEAVVRKTGYGYKHEKYIKENNEDLFFFLNSEKRLKIFNKLYDLKVFQNTGQLVFGINSIFPGSAYLDFYNKKLFISSATGIIGYSNDISGDTLTFKQIKNNISEFINTKQFEKDNSFSVKDLLIFDNKIFISFSDEITNDCWATSLLFADLNYQELKFKKNFQSSECKHSTNNIDNEFNAHQSGGRIVKFDNDNILFTTGDYRERSSAQNKNSTFGKVLKINLISSDYEIISLGHRNSQGLYFNKENNYIISTDHGPEGGDEINLTDLNNKKLKNFGWPISSYGEHYGGRIKKNENKYKKYPLHKSHKDYSFIEPLKYFVPSIGISEIVNIGENNYLVSSLKDHSLYSFKINKNQKIETMKQIEIGERIRDIIFSKKKLFLFLEDTSSVAIITLAK